MIFDTDVIVWALRHKESAIRAIDESQDRAVSVVTYLELLEGAHDKTEVRLIKSYLADLGFRFLPLSEDIGHRACVYMEEYGLSHALDWGDALIAATVSENAEVLLTGNRKHFAAVRDIQTRFFKP